MEIFSRYFTRVSYFGLLAILPIALWVLLWLGVGGAATNVYQFDNKILFFHGLRALFPYIALGVGVLISVMPVYHIVHSLLVDDPGNSVYNRLWR